MDAPATSGPGRGLAGNGVLARVFLAALVAAYIYGVWQHPAKWEEPRRLLVAQEMVERGDYIVPRVLGDLYRNKPPLHNWAIILFAGNQFAGLTPLATRLVTLAALVGVAVLLWRLGLSGLNPAPDPTPALVFASTSIVVQFGRAGEIDLPFCFCVTGALAAFELGRRHRSPLTQWGLSQALVGCGILTKGYAPLLFYPPVVLCLWRYRGAIPFSGRWFVVGLVTLLAVVAAWLVPYSMLAPAAELGDQLGREVSRVTVDAGWLAFGKHLLTYPLLVFGAMLPWALLLFSWRGSVRRASLEALSRDPFVGLALATVSWGVLLYVFAPLAEGRYLIPVLPWAAIVFSQSMDRQGRGELRFLAKLGRNTFYWAALAMLLVLYLAESYRRLGDGAAGTLIAAGVIGLVGLGSLAWPALGRHGGVHPATPLLALGLVYAAAFAGGWEARRAEQTSPFVRAATTLAPNIDDDAAVVCDGYASPGRMLAYNLAHALGHTVTQKAPEEAHWRVASVGRDPRWAVLRASSEGYSLWRVQPVEARALDGILLRRPVLSAETLQRREAQLAAAQAEFEARPELDSIIWLGRRTAYLGRFREAIEIYSRGLERFPDEPRLLRHRGHRWITVRGFDRAIADLERAVEGIAGLPDEVELDGLPNARNVPTSTLHSNIWYHLGLGYYLSGDFEQATRCYRECLRFSGNPDMLSATTYWLYLSLERQGRTADARAALAPTHADMDIIENRAYHDLLMLFRGELELAAVREGVDSTEGIELASLGYGLARWYEGHGRADEARALLERIVASREWAAFGHIAAEADLNRR